MQNLTGSSIENHGSKAHHDIGFVELLRLSREDPNCRRYCRLAFAFIGLLLVGAAVGVCVPAGLGWDFANFYDTGRRAAAWQIDDMFRPESFIAGKPPQGHMEFSGTPISALFYVPLSFFSPIWALAIFKLQGTLAYFAGLALLYAHCRRFAGDSPVARAQFLALFAFLSLIYQPFWTMYVIGGQTTPTVFLLLAMALVCHTESRFFLSALFLVIAGLIKPAFILVFVPLLAVSGRRFLRNTITIYAAVGLLSVALMGWGIHETFLAMMKLRWQYSYSWVYNSSLYVPIENLRGSVVLGDGSETMNVALSALRLAIRALVALFTAHLILRSRRQNWVQSARNHFNFLTAVMFCLLFLPTLFEHYLAVLFLPLAYAVASHRYFSSSALTLIGIIFAMAMGQNMLVVQCLRSHFSFDSIPGLVAIGLFKSAPLLLTMVFLWRHRDALYRSYAAPAWHPSFTPW